MTIYFSTSTSLNSSISKYRHLLEAGPLMLICTSAAVAILYRPYVLGAPASIPAEASEQWKKAVSRKARAAASNTNTLLGKIVELKAIHLLKPMM